MKRKTPNSPRSPNSRPAKRRQVTRSPPRLPVHLLLRIFGNARAMRSQDPALRRQNINRLARKIKRNNPTINWRNLTYMIWAGYHPNGVTYTQNEVERVIPRNHNLFV